MSYLASLLSLEMTLFLYSQGGKDKLRMAGNALDSSQDSLFSSSIFSSQIKEHFEEFLEVLGIFASSPYF